MGPLSQGGAKASVQDSLVLIRPVSGLLTLSGRNIGQQISLRGGAVDPGRLPGGVGDERAVREGEGAQVGEVADERGQVVDHELQGARRGPLQLFGDHAGDGGAPPALVRDPEHLLAIRGVLAVRPEGASEKQHQTLPHKLNQIPGTISVSTGDNIVIFVRCDEILI